MRRDEVKNRHLNAWTDTLTKLVRYMATTAVLLAACYTFHGDGRRTNTEY